MAPRVAARSLSSAKNWDEDEHSIRKHGEQDYTPLYVIIRASMAMCALHRGLGRMMMRGSAIWRDVLQNWLRW